MATGVGRLWHHPVKSMQGEPVDEVVLGPGGLVGDRAYGLVDVATGHLVSAKHPKRYGALLRCRAAFTRPPRPDEPTPPVRVRMPDGRSVSGDEIAPAVGELLGREVRLVTSIPPRTPYEMIWPELLGSDEFLSSARLAAEDTDEPVFGSPPGIAAPGTLLDLAALHVLATSTLAALAAHHPDGTWDDRRFRPNIVFADEPVDGRPADRYVEDEWLGCDLKIGERARIHIVSPTLRCPMPMLEQPGLPSDSGILRTLQHHGRRKLGDWGTFSCVGAYAEVVNPGVVRVGDPVEVTATAATESALTAAIEMLAAAARERDPLTATRARR
jgi:uncharacterized protein YcbX